MLGPTGAGKTTLLRTIAGLERPDHGAIVMAGRDVTALDPASRDIALVFQNFSLYPRCAGPRRISSSPCARRDATDPRRRRSAARVARAADLAPHRPLSARPRGADRLSGGEMQRVARSAVPSSASPRLFLMDEPLTAPRRQAARGAARRAGRAAARSSRPRWSSSRTIRPRRFRWRTGSSCCPRGASCRQGFRARSTSGRPHRSSRCSSASLPSTSCPSAATGDSGAPPTGRQCLRADGAGPSTRLLGIRPEHVALLGGEASSEGIVRVVGVHRAHDDPGGRLARVAGPRRGARAARTCGRGTACTRGRSSRLRTPFFSIQTETA